jgi:aminopeptidase N
VSRRADPSADDYVPGHGDRAYDVTHYDLDLTYDLVGNRLSGTARLDGIACEDLEQVALDLHGLEVSKVTLHGRAVKHKVRRGKVVVRPEDGLRAGDTFVLSVRYSGHPHPVESRSLGSAGWEELADGVIVAGQPHGAPSWFPCNDRPSNKASYRTSITTAPDYHVVANGRLVSSRRRASGVTWVYEQNEPMATYLATVHIGRYDLRRVDGQVPTYAVLPAPLLDRYDTAFGDQPAMIETFSRFFGPYPFESYTVVVTADDLEIPLESQGLSTFGSNFLSRDWDSVRLVAHELSHQWFGNSLTLGSWRDIWLHEGFACYAEWLWSEESGGPSADDRAVEHHKRLAEQDQDLVLSDPGPDLMFDDRLYKRGALLLHALRRTIGDTAFFALLQDWTRAHAHGTVDTSSFVAFTEQSTGCDLATLFDPWLNQEALPPLPE